MSSLHNLRNKSSVSTTIKIREKIEFYLNKKYFLIFLKKFWFRKIKFLANFWVLLKVDLGTYSYKPFICIYTWN